MAENIKQLSNAFSLGGGLNISGNQPIDSRFKVQSLVELTYDWTDKNNGGEIAKYEGLLTFVESEGKTFRYRTGASYTSGETTIDNWELVPVSADDINSLVEIPEAGIQSISVNGETVTPVDGNVDIIIPEVVHPEYELVAGDTNSVKLLKDEVAAGEVEISLSTDTVANAKTKATAANVGKIILVSGEPQDSEYLNGTYIIDGIGSVKYLATTTGSSTEADAEELIDNAIKTLDSSISAESGFLTGITIEDGKLVSYTSDTVSIPEVPEYTIQGEHPEGATKTTYKLLKDNIEVEGSIIEVNDSLIVNQNEEGDIIIADKQVLITSDLDDYLVKNIKDGDLILSLDANGEVSSTINLVYEQITEGEDDEAVTYPAINLYGKDSTLISTIDVSEFIKDGFLSSASYDEETHKLTLTWNTDSDIETPTVIDLSGLVDVHDVVGGDSETDLVKIVVNEKNENGVLTFTVSIDETNLQNKLDEINGAFIKSVVDNDTATYVKVGAETNDQVVTISVDESALSTKLDEIESRLDTIEDNTITEGDTSVENFVKLDVTTDATNNNVIITLNDTDLKTKIDSIEGNFSNYVELVTPLEEQSTLLTVEVDNTDKQNPVISLADNGLGSKIQEFDNFINSYDDADTKCTLATINVAAATTPVTDEVAVIASQTITLEGETGESLETKQAIETVNVVTKQYVDKVKSDLEGEIDSLPDTKCTLATINVAEATTPVTDEVAVIASQKIELTSETGESLETEEPIATVKVVTKQYVDNTFSLIQSIPNSDIDTLFS